MFHTAVKPSSAPKPSPRATAQKAHFPSLWIVRIGAAAKFGLNYSRKAAGRPEKAGIG
jgi:ribosomal protein L20